MHQVIGLLIILLNVYFWVITAAVLKSWLIAFGVVNLRNKWIYKANVLLDRATEPVFRPLRRFVPALGGIDFTPMIVIFGIYELMNILIRYDQTLY